jgi:death-on-curing protein
MVELNLEGISPRLAEILESAPPFSQEVRFISAAEVVKIHHLLVTDFVAAPDPIAPSGVKDPNLLASAISRQWAGDRSGLFYPKPRDNAASLLYGLCLNHCFQNGNKRTALVATLVHLDKNGYVMRGVSDKEIYDFLTNLAGHSLKAKGELVGREDELEHVIRWIRQCASPLKRGDRPITYRQLARILGRYGFDLRNPHDNYIDIYQRESSVTHSFFGLTVTRHHKARKVKTIGYPGPNAEISRSAIRQIREDCGLREQDGIDSAAFYDAEAILDYYFNHYRSVLERLAKT